MYLLRSTHWQIGLIPEIGGAIAYGQIRVGTGWYDFLRPTPIGTTIAGQMSSFIMAPWCNRIRVGKFTFGGSEYQLRPNHGDGTAIHGIGRDHPWTVTAVSPTALTMTLDSRTLNQPNFPFAFTCEQTIAVDEGRLSLSSRITNVDSVPIPVGFGHHPFFVKTLTGDHDGAHLEIPYARTYTLVDILPTGEITPVDARLDFRTPRPLGEAFVDDVLTDRTPGAPIHITYPASGAKIIYESDPIFRHLVVFIPQGKPFFAVEPVTNVNDGYNLLAAGHEGTGVIVLAPGASTEGTMSLTVAN